jgi:hypothetical protein
MPAHLPRRFFLPALLVCFFFSGVAVTAACAVQSPLRVFAS